MTNKLFMVIIIVLVIMIGYMTILGNNYSHKDISYNPQGMILIDNGKSLINLGTSNYTLNNTQTNIQNNVIPALSGNSTGNMWIIDLELNYPIIWSPYFSTISNAGITPYGLSFNVYGDNEIQNGTFNIQYDGLPESQGSIYAYSDAVFLVLPQPQFNNTSLITISFNLNYILNTTTNQQFPVNNLTMPNNDISLSLKGLPLGSYHQYSEGESVSISTEEIFRLSYPITSYYTATFKGEPNFNVTLVNPNPNQASIIYGSDNGYVNITLKNGTYNYLIFNGYTNFSGSFTISGNNTIVFISPTAFFVHSPLFDFYVYLFIVFSFLITILHFTRGSMVFLSFSSLIFLYIGYKLDIALFTINAILLMVLIFSAMISYKVFLE